MNNVTLLFTFLAGFLAGAALTSWRWRRAVRQEAVKFLQIGRKR